MLTFHVLTDFSATATNALYYAAGLARHIGGQLRLWHVLPEAAGTYFHVPLAGTDAPAPVLALAQLAEQISQLVPCTWEVVATDPLRRLSAAMGAAAGHVLVVGNSNPAKSLASAATSTALYLVRQLAQPLLVVPITFRAGPVPRRIVMDTDRRAVWLPPTAQTIPDLLAQLTCSRYPLVLSHLPSDVDHLLTRIIPEVVGIHVHTSESSPEIKEIATQLRLMGLLRGVAHTVATSRYPSIEQGIRRTATRHHADLLSFVTRTRSFAGVPFPRNVTAGLLAHSTIPVLTIAEV
ncbi:nucleotide-binding universal stress UspA family protein [Hymenobacter luteus]|uniref:Nucleotide-binding universal stress UspA family protein n=2 Tax=Hymenobacter TaxID=89966 RepID=A0A7W9WCK7_9BACT|nr:MULTISPECIES: universal stress protein [Hymenobacter]MBB4601031.1 nucleotide-binding universal stress UspA family protein [Hymenobacter latericoloratus]MBB6058762.1 nucleotide-binding universal stress UspA family protein [Hymenobacter luteus]